MMQSILAWSVILAAILAQSLITLRLWRSDLYSRSQKERVMDAELTFGQWLRRNRRAYDLTQAELMQADLMQAVLAQC